MIEDHKLDNIIDHLYGELDQAGEEAFLEDAHNSPELAAELTEHRKILTAYRLNPLPELPANAALKALYSARNPQKSTTTAPVAEDNVPSAEQVAAAEIAAKQNQSSAASDEVEKTIDLSAVPAEDSESIHAEEKSADTTRISNIIMETPQAAESSDLAAEKTISSVAAKDDIKIKIPAEPTLTDENTDNCYDSDVVANPIKLPIKLRWQRFIGMAAGLIVCVGLYALMRDDDVLKSPMAEKYQQELVEQGKTEVNDTSLIKHAEEVSEETIATRKPAVSEALDTANESLLDKSARRESEMQKQREMSAKKPAVAKELSIAQIDGNSREHILSDDEQQTPPILDKLSAKGQMHARQLQQTPITDKTPLLAKSTPETSAYAEVFSGKGKAAATNESAKSAELRSKNIAQSETKAGMDIAEITEASDSGTATAAIKHKATEEISASTKTNTAPAIPQIPEVAANEIGQFAATSTPEKAASHRAELEAIPAPELEDKDEAPMAMENRRLLNNNFKFYNEGSTSNIGPVPDAIPLKRDSLPSTMGEDGVGMTMNRGSIDGVELKKETTPESMMSKDGIGATSQLGIKLSKDGEKQKEPAEKKVLDGPVTAEQELIVIRDTITQAPQNAPKTAQPGGVPEFAQLPGVHEPIPGVHGEKGNRSAKENNKTDTTFQLDAKGSATNKVKVTEEKPEIALAPALPAAPTPAVLQKQHTQSDDYRFNADKGVPPPAVKSPAPVSKEGTAARSKRNDEIIEKVGDIATASEAAGLTANALQPPAPATEKTQRSGGDIVVSSADSATELYTKGKKLYDAGRVMTALFALEESIEKGLYGAQLVDALSLKARLEMKLGRYSAMQQTIEKLRPHSNVTANALEVLRQSGLTRARQQIEAENSAARFNPEKPKASTTLRDGPATKSSGKENAKQKFNPTTDPYYKP